MRQSVIEAVLGVVVLRLLLCAYRYIHFTQYIRLLGNTKKQWPEPLFFLGITQLLHPCAAFHQVILLFVLRIDLGAP